jgi:hypothetical protein
MNFFQRFKAGEGNRTLVICLEGRGSTIELHPRLVSILVERLGGRVHISSKLYQRNSVGREGFEPP